MKNRTRSSALKAYWRDIRYQAKKSGYSIKDVRRINYEEKRRTTLPNGRLAKMAVKAKRESKIRTTDKWNTIQRKFDRWANKHGYVKGSVRYEHLLMRVAAKRLARRIGVQERTAFRKLWVEGGRTTGNWRDDISPKGRNRR